MTEVEKYWQKISESCGDNRTWFQLNLQEQQMIIHSLNLLFHVLKPTKHPEYTEK